MLMNSLILETAVEHNNIYSRRNYKDNWHKSNIHKQSGKTLKTIGKKEKKTHGVLILLSWSATYTYCCTRMKDYGGNKHYYCSEGGQLLSSALGRCRSGVNQTKQSDVGLLPSRV